MSGNISESPSYNYRAHPAVLVEDAVYRHSGADLNILDVLSMSVPSGCIYGLTGSSGCGKTTLISCILGNHKLRSGKIFVGGICISNKSRNVVRSSIAYMPQELALYFRLSVHEMLSFFGQLGGFPQEIVESKIKELLKLMQLHRKKRCIVDTLSGGQCRRLSLAVALISFKKILVLDEPTVGLDPIIQSR